jgi:hypothetical protein
MKSYDLFVKPEPVLNRISVRRRGVWVFASIPASTFARETKSQKFYLINEPFGLVRYDRDNPAKISKRGRAGDYIVSDFQGHLNIVTAEDYKRRFPAINTTKVYTPPTSRDFMNPNYSQESNENGSSVISNSSTSNSSTSTGGSANARSGNTGTSY